MVHNWSKATDATGTAVRVVRFDYRKAIDLIDHNLLARKIKALDMPRWFRVWVLDVRSERETACQAVIRLPVRLALNPRRGASGDQAWPLAVFINDQRSCGRRAHLEVCRRHDYHPNDTARFD